MRVNHIVRELKKKFAKDGEYRLKLNALKKLKKEYPKSKLTNQLLKIYRQKIYGFRGVDFVGLNVSNIFLKDCINIKNDTVEIEEAKFDVSLPQVKGIFFWELQDLLIADSYFMKHFQKDDFYNIVSEVIAQEGPYQYESVFLQPEDVVIDAGANMGMFSIFANHFYKCKCYAFEPVKSTIDLLKNNIALNGMEQSINIVPYALSDSVGEVEFQVEQNNIDTASFVISRENKIGVEKVNSITLDQWVKENDIQKIDFIKADIEGAERNMLLGATEVLKNFAPKLSICTYHLPDDSQVIEKNILDANPNYKVVHAHKKLYAYVPKVKEKTS